MDEHSGEIKQEEVIDEKIGELETEYNWYHVDEEMEFIPQAR